jgi:hypothetical protein
MKHTSFFTKASKVVVFIFLDESPSKIDSTIDSLPSISLSIGDAFFVES